MKTSQQSSKRSASRHRTRTGDERVYESFITPAGANLEPLLLQVFAFFKSLEFSPPRQVTRLGMILDILQVASFAFNPHLPWGDITKFISYLSYFTHLPLWDAEELNVSYLGCTIILWVLVALLLFVVTGAVILGTNTDTKVRYFSHFRVSFILFGSVCYVPLLQFFLSLMVCYEEKLWAFPNESCTGVNVVHTAGAGVGIMLTIGFAVIVNGFLFEISTKAGTKLARADSRLDLLVLGHKLATCVLMHHFLARGMVQWYCVYVACSCFTVGALWVIRFPYYNAYSTFLRVTGNWLGAYFALCGCIMDGTTPKNEDVTYLSCGAAVVVALSWKYHDIRISRKFKRAFHRFRYHCEMTVPDYTLPHGLGKLPHQLQAQSEDTDTEDGGVRVSFAVPLLDTVVLATDCEVAARFIKYFSKSTSLVPTYHMYQYVSYIYQKSRQNFRYDSSLSLSYVGFLIFNRKAFPEARFVLSQLDAMDCNVISRYQAFKLAKKLKVDSTQLERYNKAKRFHRSCLKKKIEFWRLLQPKELDREMLDSCASQICKGTEQGLSEYLLALRLEDKDKQIHKSDIRMIAHYGLFFEQVIQNQDLADRCFCVGSDLIKVRELKATRGAKRAAGVDTGLGQLPTHSEARSTDEHSRDSGSSGRDAIVQAGRMLNIVFAALTTLLSGFFILSIVTSNILKLLVRSIEAAGKAHSYALQAVVMVEQQTEVKPENHLCPTCAALPSVEHQASFLADTVDALHTNMNSFFWGDWRPTTSRLTSLMTGPYFLSEYGKYDEANMRRNWVSDAHESLWTLTYRYIEVLLSFTGAGGLDTDGIDYAFITRQIPESFSMALNTTTVAFLDWNRVTNETTRHVLLVIYSISAALVVAVFVALMIKFLDVEKIKQSIRNVVTVIPKPMVTDLVQRAKEDLRRYDKHMMRPETLLSRELTHEDGEKEEEMIIEQFEYSYSDDDEAEEVAEHPTETAPVVPDASSVTLENAQVVGNTVPMQLRITQFLIFVIVLSLIGISGFALDMETKEGAVSKGAATSVRVVDAMLQLNELRGWTSRYVTEPFEEHYHHIENAMTQILWDTQLRQEILYALAPDSSDSIVQGIHDLYHNTEMLFELYQTIVTLSLVGSNQSLADHPISEGHKWYGPYARFVNLDVDAVLPFKRPLVNHTHDLDPSLNQVELAEEYVASEYVTKATAAVVSAWHDMMDTVLKEASDEYRDYLSICNATLIYETIATGLMSVLLLMAISMSKNHLRRMCLFGIVLVLSIVGLTLSQKGLVDLKDTKDQLDGADDLRVFTGFVKLITTMNLETSSFIFSGDIARHMEYRQHVSDFEEQREDVLQVLHHESAAEGMAKLEQLIHLWEVGQKISIAEKGIDANLTMFSDNPYWSEADREAIPKHALEWFLADGHLFTNYTYDMQRDLTGVALHNVVTGGSLELMTDSFKLLMKGLSVRHEEFVSFFDDYQEKQYSSSFSRLVCYVCAALVLVLYMVSFLRSAVSHTGVKIESSKSRSKPQMIDQQLKKMVYALLIVLALVTGLFVLCLITVTYSDTVVTRLYSASSREWLVARAMLYADNMVTDKYRHDVYKVLLFQTIDHLKYANRQLYFSGNGYNGVGEDSAQDSLLFESNATIPNPLSEECPSGEYDNIVSELKYGLQSAIEKWSALCHSLSRDGAQEPAVIVDTVTKLREMYRPLMAGLTRSTALYHSNAIDTIDSNILMISMAVFVAVVVMLFDFFAIFRPIMEELRNDERTTNLILRLLPTMITDMPEVSAMLENGVAGKADKDLEVSDTVVQMSPIPLIAIDHNGIIMRFSYDAVKSYFGYSAIELTGSNVRVLMPQEYSEKHDQFLANYRRTGIKHVINQTRHVNAKKKNGDLFPAEILVRQFKCSGEDMFIGVIKPLMKALHLQAMITRNANIQELNIDGVLSIDTVGTILTANNSVCKMFEFTSEELLGENIKMLMPIEVAQNHDEYLAAYLETRKRSMIGKIRRSKGQKKSGKIFQLEAKVEEVATNPPVYVGYLRDVTDLALLESQHKLADAISKLSITPCIVIDAKGSVMSFSQAAEKLFGYTAEQTVGKNIKMLMPLKTANIHDEYLSTYAETGKRHVVGSSRIVEGKAKDGTPIPLDLFVEEVIHVDRGTTFVGYATDLTLIKKAEADKYLYSEIDRQAPNGTITATPKGIITGVNPRTLSMFGYNDVSDLVGQNLTKLMPKSYAEKHQTYLDEYACTRVKGVIDSTRKISGQKRDRTAFPIELRVAEIENGENTFFLGFLRDQTREQQLEVSNGVNQMALKVSEEAVVLINDFGLIQQFSPAAEKSWGYTPEEVIGRNVKMLTPPDVAAKHDGYLKAYVKTGVKHVIDSSRTVTTVAKDGLEFTATLRITEVLIHGESVFVGFVRNITRERECATKKALIGTLEVITPLVVVISDRAGVINTFNDHAVKLFGWEKNEAIGKNVSILVPGIAGDRHDAFMAQYRQSGPARVVGESVKIAAKHKSGKLLNIQILITELQLYRDGTRHHLLAATMTDISELIAYEEISKGVNTVTDLSTTAAVVIDDNGTVSKFSRAAEKLLHYQASEIVGGNVNKLMPEPHKSKHDGYLATYKRTGMKRVIDSSLHVEALRKEGTVVPILLKVVEVVTNGQSMFIGFAVDCSDIWQAELACQRNELITQLSVTPFIRINSNCIMERVSDHTSTMFGYPLGSLVGKNVNILMEPAIAAKHNGYITRYIETGVKKVIGKQLLINAYSKSGERIPMILMVAETRDINGDRAFWGNIADRREDLEMEKQQKINETLVTKSMQPLVMIDRKGSVKMVSDSLCEMFGYKKAEVMGANIKMLMPKEVAVKHDGYLANYLKTGAKTIIDRKVRLDGVSKAGVTIPVYSLVMENSIGEGCYFGYLIPAGRGSSLLAEQQVTQSILHQSIDPIITIDQKGIIQFFNLAAQKEFGYDASVVVGTNVKMLMLPETAAKHDGYLEAYVRTKKKTVLGSTFSQIAVTATGARIPIELQAQEFGEGETVTYSAYIKNLTEVETLKHTSKIVDTMIDQSPVTLIMINDKCIITKYSKAGEALFGFTEEQLLGKNVSLLMDDETARKHDGYIKKYLIRGVKTVIGKTTIGLKGKRKDGSLFPLELTIQEIRKEGVTPLFIGCVRDYTADLETRATIETGRAILRASVYPLMAISCEGTILRFSESSEGLFGYSDTEVLQRNVKMLMPPETAAEHDGYLKRYLDTKVKRVVDTHRVVEAMGKNGKRFELELMVKEIVINDMVLFVSYLRDLSAEKDHAWESQMSEVVAFEFDEPLISIDNTCLITQFNRAAENIFQFTCDQIMGRNVRVLMPDDVSSQHDAYVINYLHSPGTMPLSSSRSVTSERKDGSQFTCTITVRELRLQAQPPSFTARFHIKDQSTNQSTDSSLITS